MSDIDDERSISSASSDEVRTYERLLEEASVVDDDMGTYVDRRLRRRGESEESRLVEEYNNCLDATHTQTSKADKSLDHQSRKEAFNKLLNRLDEQRDAIFKGWRDDRHDRDKNNAIDRGSITYPSGDDRVPAALTCLFPHEIYNGAQQDAATSERSAESYSESSWASPSEHDDGDDGQEMAGVTTQDSRSSTLQGTRIERWVQGVDVHRERSHQDQGGASAGSAASRAQARLSSRLDNIHLHSPLVSRERSLSPIPEAVDSDADFEDVRKRGYASRGVEEPHKLRAADPYRHGSDPRSLGSGRERDTSPGYRQSRHNYPGTYQEDDPTHVRHDRGRICEPRSESHRRHRARQAETEEPDEVDDRTASMVNAAQQYIRGQRTVHARRHQGNWSDW